MAAVHVPERFEVLAEISATRAEVLLRARDRMLQREVLLKCPGPGLASTFRDRSLRDSVIREARALARVQPLNTLC